MCNLPYHITILALLRNLFVVLGVPRLTNRKMEFCFDRGEREGKKGLVEWVTRKK